MKILGELLFSILARSIPEKKADILKELSLGQEFEGLVLGKQGPLELIEFRGQVIRAQSETPLTQGAKVKLRVINTKDPIQVRLIKQEFEGEKNDIHRDYLNLKASELRFRQAIRTLLINSEKVRMVNGNHEDMTLYGNKQGTSFFTRFSELIADLSIDEEPSSDKIKALVSIMQRDSEKDLPILKSILNEVLSKIDTPACKGTHAVENPLAKSNINGLSSPGGNKDKSENENQRHQKVKSQGPESDREKLNSTRGSNNKTSTKSDSGPFYSTNRWGQGHGKTMTKSFSSMLSVPKKQRLQYPSSFNQDSKSEAIVESAKGEKGSQGKVATKHDSLGLGKKAESSIRMDGKGAGMAAKQDIRSPLFFDNIQVKGTSRCPDTSPALSSYKKIQTRMETSEPSPISLKKIEEGDIINKRSIGQPKARPHAILEGQCDASNTDDPMIKIGTSDLMSSSKNGQRFKGPISKRIDAHVKLEPDPLQQGEDQALKSQGIQALKELDHGPKGISEALRTLSLHLDSAQQYQGHAGDSLPSFFIVPLWFGQGKGTGHLALWNDLDGHEKDIKGHKRPCQNLFFDLELSRLGPVRIHVRMHENGLLLSIWARQDPLTILRSSLRELTDRLSDKGLLVQGVDLSPFEFLDSDPISSSKGMQTGFHWVT